MSGYPFPGPRAPENNPLINPQYYQPVGLYISAISLGETTTITTQGNTEFVIGQIVRIIIPPAYGSRQLNEKEGLVIALPASNEITLNIDSSQNVDAFISSPSNPFTSSPQVFAIGDINSGAINSGRSGNQTYIDGSFINISPL